MQYRHAKKLHNGDEVTIKATGDVMKVQYIDLFKPGVVANTSPHVQIFGTTKTDGWTSFHHTQVR